MVGKTQENVTPFKNCLLMDLFANRIVHSNEDFFQFENFLI